jgi:hypothetical protein
MYDDIGDKLSAMYEAINNQLIDQIYFEEEDLTEEDIEAIALAKEEEVFDKWLAEQECNRCVCH